MWYSGGGGMEWDGVYAAGPAAPVAAAAAEDDELLAEAEDM